MDHKGQLFNSYKLNVIKRLSVAIAMVLSFLVPIFSIGIGSSLNAVAATTSSGTSSGSITVAGSVISNSGVALSGICVGLFSDTGNNSASPFYAALTASNGDFSINADASGPWTLQINSSICNNGAAVANYPNANYESGLVYAANNGAGSNVINGSVNTGAITLYATNALSAITGTVTSSNGSPISGICVTGNAPNNGVLFSTFTNTNGSYSLPADPRYPVVVEFNTGC